MSFDQVAGVRIAKCHYREGYRTFFFDKSWPGDGKTSLLIFIKKGKIAFEINRRRFVAGKNDIVLWDTGLLYRMFPLKGVPVTYYAVMMDVLYASGWVGGVSGLGFPGMLKILRPGPLLRLLAGLYKTVNSGGRYALQESAILGLRLLCLLDENLRRHTGALRERFSPADERIRNVLLHIEAHYKARLDIKELVAVAGVCRAQLTRLFKRHTGMSPHQYVLEKKINKAREFLMRATETPTSVSLDMGFHDYPHFCRTFKRIAGISPSAFIRRHFQRDYR